MCHCELHPIEISLMQLIWILFPKVFIELNMGVFLVMSQVIANLTLQCVYDLTVMDYMALHLSKLKFCSAFI